MTDHTNPAGDQPGPDDETARVSEQQETTDRGGQREQTGSPRDRQKRKPGRDR